VHEQQIKLHWPITKTSDGQAETVINIVTLNQPNQEFQAKCTGANMGIHLSGGS